jgi:hypothetical protein
MCPQEAQRNPPIPPRHTSEVVTFEAVGTSDIGNHILRMSFPSEQVDPHAED